MRLIDFANLARWLYCFAHLVAPNAAFYQDILSVFADGRRDFRLNLRSAEIGEAISGRAG